MVASTELGAIPHRFSVDDVDRMVEAGVLHPRQRVELVDGELVDVSPQGNDHISLKDELHERIRAAYGPDVHVRDQGPLLIGPHDRPEPDLAVLRGRPRDYLKQSATGADAVLVIEVSKTTVRFDRRKAFTYARGGVPEYWILEIDARRLVVHRDPRPEGYASIRILAEDEELLPPGTDTRLHVRDLLP